MGTNGVRYLQQLAANDDWPAIEALVRSADQQEIERLGRWYDSGGRALVNRFADGRDRPGQEVLAASVVAARLETEPERCVKTLGRLSSWTRQDPEAAELVARTLAERGPEWAAAVLEVGEGMKPISRWFGCEDLHAVLGRVAVLIGRPVVPSPAFLDYWDGLLSSRARQAVGDPADEESMAELYAEIDATPFLVATVVAALDTGQLPRERIALQHLGIRLRDHAGRAEVVAAALRTLARRDRPGRQDVVARLLDDLRLVPADLTPLLPLVIGALPTVAPSMLATVLPPLLDVVTDEGDPTDAGDVARVVLSGKAKGLRVTVLTAVTGWLESGGDLADLAVEILREVRAGEDATLAARAGKALIAAGFTVPEAGAVSSAPVVGWVPVPPRPRRAISDPIEQSAAGMMERLAVQRQWLIRNVEAQWLDLIFSWRMRDEAGLRAQLMAGDVGGGSRALQSAWLWAWTGEPLDEHTSGVIRQKRESGSTFMKVRGSLPPSPRAWFTGLLAAETLTRPLDGAPLLSNPTADDGTLDLPALAERIRATSQAGAPWRPYDLQQAMFRLADPAEPTVPHKILTGLTLRGPAPGDPDGVDLIRRWLLGERLAVPGTADGVLRVGELTSDDPDHPIPALRGFGIGIEPREVELSGARAVAAQLDLWPFSAQALALHLLPPAGPRPDPRSMPRSQQDAARRRAFQQFQRFDPAALSILAEAAPAEGSPAAPAVLTLAAALTVHDDADRRAVAAEVLLELAGRGALEFDGGYPEAVREMLTRNEFSLARAGQVWEQVILAGGLQAIWPTVVTAIDTAASLPRTLPGLADLLRMLRPYLSAVPHGVSLPGVDVGEVLPRSIFALAARKGATKARSEARALLAVR